jgi:hypothetical protein
LSTVAEVLLRVVMQLMKGSKDMVMVSMVVVIRELVVDIMERDSIWVMALVSREEVLERLTTLVDWHDHSKDPIRPCSVNPVTHGLDDIGKN